MQKLAQIWEAFLAPGRFVLSALAICAPLALLAGWVSAGAIALASLFLLLTTLPFVLSSSSFGLEFETPERRIVAGTPAAGKLRVENTGSRPSFWALAQIPLGEEVFEISVPPLLPGRAHLAEIPLPTERRQVVLIGPASLVKTDPLRQVRLVKEFGEPSKMFVHPVTVQIPPTSAGQIRDLEGEATRFITAADIPFHALREYRPGDPIKSIHWKSTAKFGELMSRQFEETRRAKTVILVSTNPADFANSEEFETAISCAGSLGCKAIFDRREIEVYTTERAPSGLTQLSAKTPRSLLDALSALKFSENSLGLKQACQIVAEKTDATFCAAACGSVLHLKELERAASALPAGTKSAFLRAEIGASPRSVSAANLSVITVAEPADIRAFIRRRVI